MTKFAVTKKDIKLKEIRLEAVHLLDQAIASIKNGSPLPIGTEENQDAVKLIDRTLSWLKIYEDLKNKKNSFSA